MKKHDRTIIGWTGITHGVTPKRNTSFSLGDLRRCFVRLTGVTFVKLEGQIGLKVTFKSTLTPTQKEIYMGMGGQIAVTYIQVKELR